MDATATSKPKSDGYGWKTLRVSYGLLLALEAGSCKLTVDSIFAPGGVYIMPSDAWPRGYLEEMDDEAMSATLKASQPETGLVAHGRDISLFACPLFTTTNYPLT
jgi:hypothetical protein